MSEEISSKKNWHKIARTGVLICKFFLLLCLAAIVIHFTCTNVRVPYSYYCIGIELALFAMSVFMVLRMSTFKPRQQYNEKYLLNKDNKKLLLLLINISSDIERFEEAASYFFNGVRVYKYSTMILSGISTILLGLSFKTISIPYQDVFPEATKNIAFVIGAIVTVYSGLMTYWNIEKYWLQNKSVENKLRALKDEIENEDRSGTMSNETAQKYFEKYQLIKAEFYKYWDGALSGRNAQTS
ncbi:MAG: hypothetical protein DI535_05905 [Citrobacter freundii]|nr:MAG: hypothetical protein DI535_05905 [Citrobacter freundii]